MIKNRKFLHNYKIYKTNGTVIDIFADDHNYDDIFFHFYISPDLEKFKENQILIRSVHADFVEDFVMFSDVSLGQIPTGIDGYWSKGKLIVLSEEKEK